MRQAGREADSRTGKGADSDDSYDRDHRDDSVDSYDRDDRDDRDMTVFRTN